MIQLYNRFWRIQIAVLAVAWGFISVTGYAQDDDEYDYEYEGEYDEDEDEDEESSESSDSPSESESVSQSSSLDIRDIEYEFSMGGKEDPFVPSVTAMHFNLKVSKSPVQSMTRPKEYALSELQKYKLSELKVVGVWKSEEAYKALITTPKTAVIAQVGDFIGERNGKIVEIDSRNILVRIVSVISDDVDDIRKICYENILFENKDPGDARIDPEIKCT